jgi:GNAT superfamily N-acetyltransferase
MARWTPADVMTIARVRADEPDAAELLGEYVAGLRALVPDFDPARSVSADPEEMVPPQGAFLVVREAGRPLACGGLKTHEAGLGEIKRMYVRAEARRRGLGAEVLEALEAEARGLGMSAVVLDTRVPEARAAVSLYRASGYVDVPAFNENPYANVWLRKQLG